MKQRQGSIPSAAIFARPFVAAAGALLSCSVPSASAKETGPAVPGEPLHCQGEEEHCHRLQEPAGQCKDPVKPVPVKPPPDGARWLIHAKGVGSIPREGPFPPVVLEQEGKTYQELVLDPLKGFADDFERMEAGVIDSEGFRTVRPKSIDISIKVHRTGHVLSLSPGQTLKTEAGVGLGSSLGQLTGAHGDYVLHRLSHPEACAVSVDGLPGVYFYFDSCDAACKGGPVRKIFMEGTGEDPDLD